MRFIKQPASQGKSRASVGGPSLEAARAANQCRQRLIRDAQAVHRLGERATFELLDEIAIATGRRPVVEAIVERFAAIDPDALALAGGDGFPATLFGVTAVSR